MNDSGWSFWCSWCPCGGSVKASPLGSANSEVSPTGLEEGEQGVEATPQRVSELARALIGGGHDVGEASGEGGEQDTVSKIDFAINQFAHKMALGQLDRKEGVAQFEQLRGRVDRYAENATSLDECREAGQLIHNLEIRREVYKVPGRPVTLLERQAMSEPAIPTAGGAGLGRGRWAVPSLRLSGHGMSRSAPTMPSGSWRTARVASSPSSRDASSAGGE